MRPISHYSDPIESPGPSPLHCSLTASRNPSRPPLVPLTSFKDKYLSSIVIALSVSKYLIMYVLPGTGARPMPSLLVVEVAQETEASSSVAYVGVLTTPNALGIVILLVLPVIVMVENRIAGNTVLLMSNCWLEHRCPTTVIYAGDLYRIYFIFSL
ncbi:hypothetical protein F4802DRAFT_575609, partial [Xylaria palmicola]